MKLHRKAQEAKTDMLVWYVVCFIVVIAAVGGLYGAGIIGTTQNSGSLIDNNLITSAAIAVPTNGNSTQEQAISPNNVSNSTLE